MFGVRKGNLFPGRLCLPEFHYTGGGGGEGDGENKLIRQTDLSRMKRGLKILLGLVAVPALFFLTVRLITGNAIHSKTIQAEKQFQSGDITFHTSRSSQSKAIQLATKSKYSHMGIVYEIDSQLYVYEAVQPVKLTGLKEWIKRGENSHYVVKRLKNNDLLTIENLKRMREVGEKFKGKNYDLYFEWSDDKIYCSELVWKIYKETLNMEIGELQELKDFDLTSDIVKDKMKERYGNKIPLGEKVISPSAMFESNHLKTVIEN